MAVDHEVDGVFALSCRYQKKFAPQAPAGARSGLPVTGGHDSAGREVRQIQEVDAHSVESFCTVRLIDYLGRG